MRDYVPFNISYWSELSREFSLTDQSEKPSNVNLEQITKINPNRDSLFINTTDNHSSEGGDVLETIIEERRKFLVEEISKLDILSKKRKQINKDLFLKIEYDIIHHKNLIYELGLWPRGINQTIERRRIHLERILVVLEQEKRKEEPAYWRDIVMLTKDLRILLKQYMELLIRKRIIQNE